MAEAIGTASAIVALVSTALAFIQKIRKTRDGMKDGPKTLNELSTQLNDVSDSLRFLKQEPRLQVDIVEKQIILIVQITKEMNVFFEQLEAAQSKAKLRQMTHTILSGDREEKELVGLINRLSNARQSLILRVSVVHVGLTGTADDGFMVARDTVLEVNKKMERVLGTQLLLAKIIQEGHSSELSNGMIRLQRSDLIELERQTEASINGQGGDKTQQQHLIWERNKTGDEPRTFTGNLGVDESLKLEPVHATVTDSEFGKGARFMFGHVGGQQAQGFNEHFWNN
ncbi:Fc.00g037420.m01.CDS01 [Cosmosporella sp. VM-42]